ncbi:aminoglycoside phosphotransferase family protein [Patescibacteria group bacterium AH-259-L07]|nr:aminoglycoside phosphotransferase family protein [Patescibacteria group bacterium AH-259-L07]
MIFISINRKIDTRKALDKAYMLSLFKRRREKFLSKREKLVDIHIDLVRNFRGKFRNMSLKYELITNYGTTTVRAKIHKRQDTPYRAHNTLEWFKAHGLGKYTAQTLDYYRPLNMFFYKEAPGISFEELMSQKPRFHIQFTPSIAQFLKKVHNISAQPRFLPIKDEEQEKKERRHWFFLVRKCAPQFYPLFSDNLKKLWRVRKQYEDLFLDRSQFRLVHGDFHWGNILTKIKNQKSKIKNYFKVIDFGYAFLGDPLEDVGGFLAQTDSMFHYYAPDFILNADIIRKRFIKNYFGSLGGPTSRQGRTSEQIRLYYFEIQKILEMAAIVAFLEQNPESKAKGMKRLLTKAEEKIKSL